MAVKTSDVLTLTKNKPCKGLSGEQSHALSLLLQPSVSKARTFSESANGKCSADLGHS